MKMQSRNRSVVWPSLAGLLAAVVVAGCTQGGAAESDFTLQSSTVERRTVEASVEATGTIEPIRVIDVKSQASGEILNMPVELGDRVDRGDLLLEIDPRDVVNELEQAEANLQQARAQLDVNQRRLERARALRDSGVVTEEELETAIVNHANAQTSFQRAQASLELAREQREDATVRAPLSGTIVEKLVEEGAVITSTNSVTGGTSLLGIADLSEVQVRTLVDETDIGRVQPGLPATITVEAYPERSFEGQVLKIEPQATVEQNVTMFAVLIRIDNEERLLRPGMNGDVEIVLGQEENVLALPNAGVKTPAEARQLVNALGMDASLLEQQPPVLDQDRGQEEAAGEDDDLPTPEELRSMTREERRELLQSLDADQRRRLAERMRAGAGFGGPGGRSGDSPASQLGSSTRTGFVFVRDDGGDLSLKPVLLGLSSWDYTEIAAGLDEGDTVVNVPLALVQQTELLNRFRERSGVPGMNSN
jgi:HlyD family secretion protein